MTARRHADRTDQPARSQPVQPRLAPSAPPAEEEIDWRGTLERVREERRGGRAPDGVQRGFT